VDEKHGDPRLRDGHRCVCTAGRSVANRRTPMLLLGQKCSALQRSVV
jgi:hypothetical protein